MTTIINAKDFLYMTRFSSNEETRFCLKGVLVEPHNGYVLLVATDGSQMGVLRLDQPHAKAGAAFILTNDKTFTRSLKVGKHEQVHIVCHQERVNIHVVGGRELSEPDEIELTNCSVTFSAKQVYVNGTFPDWRRVVPELGGKEQGSVAAVNPELLANMQAMNGLEPGITFQWNGDSAMLVANSDPRFLGMVMPRRGADGMKLATRRAYVPAWQTLSVAA